MDDIHICTLPHLYTGWQASHATLIGKPHTDRVSEERERVRGAEELKTPRVDR